MKRQRRSDYRCGLGGVCNQCNDAVRLELPLVISGISEGRQAPVIDSEFQRMSPARVGQHVDDVPLALPVIGKETIADRIRPGVIHLNKNIALLAGRK